MNSWQTAGQYFPYGFTHVIPLGYDHILFILTLFLLTSRLKAVIVQCSLFTIAHSISLGLAAAGYFVADSDIVEPLIALSIVFTSVENIVHSNVSNWRLLIVFLFGLIHGMGFATAFKNAGIPDNHFIASLLFFNAGVEAGQISIILAAYFLISKWFSNKSWYKERIVYPLSAIIACIAMYWTIDRIFFTPL